MNLLKLICRPHTKNVCFRINTADSGDGSQWRMLLLLLLQSCTTLCDRIDGSPPGSPIPGILQARTLEWVAISFSNAWKWKVKVKSLSRVRLLATPWTAAYQASPSMGFSRQEYWSGVPLPSAYCCYATLCFSVQKSESVIRIHASHLFLDFLPI